MVGCCRFFRIVVNPASSETSVGARSASGAAAGDVSCVVLACAGSNCFTVFCRLVSMVCKDAVKSTEGGKAVGATGAVVGAVSAGAVAVGVGTMRGSGGYQGNPGAGPDWPLSSNITEAIDLYRGATPPNQCPYSSKIGSGLHFNNVLAPGDHVTGQASNPIFLQAVTALSKQV